MPDVAEKQHLRLPLHVLAAAGTTILLVVMAIALGWNAYDSTRRVISSTVDETIRHISATLTSKIQSILIPAENQLNMLAYHQITGAHTLKERLRAVSLARTVLDSNPLMDAWYVGYANGDFILFRHLRNSTLRSVYRAPQKAALMVQTITTTDKGERQGEILFYDSRSKLLSRKKQPGYDFDPRQRSWYSRAIQEPQSIITNPYLFYTTRQIGTTLARRTPDGMAVVGIDATVEDLGDEIASLKITSGSQVAIIDSLNEVVAYEDPSRIVDQNTGDAPRLTRIEQFGLPVLREAASLAAGSVQRRHATIGTRDWELISVPLGLRSDGRNLRVLMGVPDEELFSEARHVLRRQLFIMLLLIVLSAPAGYWVTQRIVRPLRQLAEEARSVARFDFRSQKTHRSIIAEVDLLTSATSQMRSTISQFLDVNAALNSEHQLERLLNLVLSNVSEATHARSGALYLYDAHTRTLRRSQVRPEVLESDEFPAHLDCSLNLSHPAVQVARQQHSILRRIGDGDNAFCAVALKTLGEEFVGVLILELAVSNEEMRKPQDSPQMAFIEVLSSTAAVAIETRRLVESQKALIEAMIQLLAGAIDAKSPYTGGHCQRVPVLTRMLAEAASGSKQAAFREFNLNDEMREAVHVASWLHDCGKITTPEYVVDKATKLETLYNRIHEIRMRFEVLKRDAHIAYWCALSQGQPEKQARATLVTECKTLDDDFAFIAECNHGGEFLDDEEIGRLQRIAQRTWERTLDDRLGLSTEEMQRLKTVSAPALPVQEPLLADRPEHLVIRPEHDAAHPEQDLQKNANPYGFRLSVPAYKFNRGELHNLAVRRGTLTEEERFIINDHIVQTIIMLNRMPFPKHLRDVPEMAGGHHEHMDGSGYPKGLTGEQMSLTARIMAIADVFEALTAADRPYKKAKTLSESLGLMATMVRNRHLDAELFRLFIEEGVYREYAELYLRPEQIDSVDIDALRNRMAA